MSLLSRLLRLVLSIAILAYLVWNSLRPGDDAGILASLGTRPVDWGFLTAGSLVVMAATLLTFVRWWVLLRAVGVRCTLNRAVRIGFWGLLCSLAPLGIVTGDAARAYLLAREDGDHVAEGVASVLVDRVLGVYFLFVLAAAGILFMGRDASAGSDPTLAYLDRAVLAATAVGAVGLTLALLPTLTGGRLRALLVRVPRVGPPLGRVVTAVRMFGHHPGTLAACAVFTLTIHALSTVACYLFARGFSADVLPLADHVVAVPLAMAASILPLPVGPFEFALDYLYTHLPNAVPGARGLGLLVAGLVRLAAVVLAVLGFVCYFSFRHELADIERHGEGDAVPAPVMDSR